MAGDKLRHPNALLRACLDSDLAGSNPDRMGALPAPGSSAQSQTKHALES